MCLAGIEPATSRLGGERSIQLSYRHKFLLYYTMFFTFLQEKLYLITPFVLIHHNIPDIILHIDHFGEVILGDYLAL